MNLRGNRGSVMFLVLKKCLPHKSLLRDAVELKVPLMREVGVPAKEATRAYHE